MPSGEVLPSRSPAELKVEVTSACSARCAFCHQDFGHARVRTHAPVARLMEWLDWAVREGIHHIRFTGGEPTLHPDLPALCAEAARLGLSVTINTNALGAPDRLLRLAPFVRTVKVSVPALREDLVDALTGVRGALTRKLRMIGLLLEEGFDVQILTVMIPENTPAISSFLDLVDGFPGAEWIPLRVEPSPQAPRPIDHIQMRELAAELALVAGSQPGRGVRLHLATPFCAASSIEEGRRVFAGRVEDCGPFESLTVTSEGNLVACYSCRIPFAHAASLSTLQGDPEHVSLTSLAALPSRCRSCQYLVTCGGGCRSPLALEPRAGGLGDYLIPPDEAV